MSSSRNYRFENGKCFEIKDGVETLLVRATRKGRYNVGAAVTVWDGEQHLAGVVAAVKHEAHLVLVDIAGEIKSFAMMVVKPA